MLKTKLPPGLLLGSVNSVLQKRPSLGFTIALADGSGVYNIAFRSAGIATADTAPSRARLSAQVPSGIGQAPQKRSSLLLKHGGVQTVEQLNGSSNQ